MINSKKHNITSKQLMIFIISSEIGFGIVSLPSTLAEKVGHDGWISVLLTGILCTVAVYFIMILLRRYSDKSIFQINILLYGKILGTFINFALFAYLSFTTSVASRTLTELIRVTLLKLTPNIALSAALLLPTIYVCSKGLKVLARLSSLISFSYIVAIIFYLSVLKHASLSFIQPVGISGIQKILQGMLITGFSYLGFELSAVVYPHVTDKDKAIKYAVYANIFTTFFFTLIVFLLTILTGEEKLGLTTFPLFNIATSIRIPIFERADIFFVMLWFPVMGSAVRSYYCSTYHFIRLIFKLDDELFPMILFSIFIVILGRIPKGLTQLSQFTKIVGYLGIGVVVYLIVSFLFSFVNKRGVLMK
ncbi:GerAB/ArcD/ProY family transporter [Clostridium sp. OS1-26]|uniref:GerAB/ArcD/ProY family transporter n=1 Tax=Clostridium sp. OS1-26 TaxID=3070681 RepID=UPI0027DF6BFF|nr:GerAB/ArcD/ProY family transporter [Clostridium sp. OS1-26]WML35236.1 GerAB/ArcD/ProY family transporter [Clostridium sp. OS1-26]